jgi:hypothetical protein
MTERLVDEGYVRQLVVDRRVRRKGVGRALMRRVADDLRSRGARAWRLNVKPENDAAVALYRSLGLDVQYHTVALFLAWDQIRALAAESGAPAIRPLPQDEDAIIERSFRLPAGSACARAPPGSRPAGLHRRGYRRGAAGLRDLRSDPRARVPLPRTPPDPGAGPVAGHGPPGDGSDPPGADLHRGRRAPGGSCFLLPAASCATVSRTY